MHLLTRVYGKYAALRGLLVYSVTSLYFELHNALFSMHRLDNSHFQRLSTLVHFHSRIITITVTRNVTKYTYLEQDNHRLLWLFCRFILHYSSNCNNRGICLGNSHHWRILNPRHDGVPKLTQLTFGCNCPLQLD